jgi:hypothetical protein
MKQQQKEKLFSPVCSMKFNAVNTLLGPLQFTLWSTEVRLLILCFGIPLKLIFLWYRTHLLIINIVTI